MCGHVGFRVGRIVVEPDGRSGAFFADGRETRRFHHEGGPLRGSIAFRVTHGRSAVVDDVRFFQIDASGEREVPDYIQLEPNQCKATFLRAPALADVPYATQMEPHLVVEYYSR